MVQAVAVFKLAQEPGQPAAAPRTAKVTPLPLKSRQIAN
jgi:hypothetical protein